MPGFHKIDTEQWEFGNEDFLRGKKSLLRNIHRRKSSQVQPFATCIGSSIEIGGPEMEGELHRLRCEKNLLTQEVVRLQQEHLVTVQQMDVLNKRTQAAQLRQKQMVSFLAKVLKNPVLFAHLRQQKEQREIASTRARRKFLKHQPTEPDKFMEQERVNCQLNFPVSSSSTLIMDIEGGIGDQCRDNLLHDMVEKLGLDAGSQEVLGTSDKVVEEMLGAAYLDSNDAAFKTKDAVSTQIDCSFGTTEYFISFLEDTTPEDEIKDSFIPITGSISRRKRDVTNFKVDFPSTSKECLQSFAEEVYGEEVLPDVMTPPKESIIKEADIWIDDFEVAGGPFSFHHDAWDTLVLYDAQDQEVGAGSCSPWDVGTSVGEECSAIGKHVRCESSSQDCESQAAVPSEDPKSIEP